MATKGIYKGQEIFNLTNEYDKLVGRPKINGVELTGNKTSNQLGMYTKAETDSLLASKENKQFVSALPTPTSPNTTYYVGPEEGTTDTYHIYSTDSLNTLIDLGTNTIDLSNYYTKTQVDSMIDDKVDISDIVDNLTSSDTDKPLSAKQGKALNDNKMAKTAVYNVGDVYETLSTTETVSTLAERFGGTWEAMSDRVEDNWKEHTFSFSNSAGTITVPKVYARVTEDKQMVDIQIRFTMELNSVSSTTSEIEIANNIKLDETLIGSIFDSHIIGCFADGNNATQIGTVYISIGSNKVWFGPSKTGGYYGACQFRKLIPYNAIFTPDRIFKRFKRTA